MQVIPHYIDLIFKDRWDFFNPWYAEETSISKFPFHSIFWKHEFFFQNGYQMCAQTTQLCESQINHWQKSLSESSLLLLSICWNSNIISAFSPGQAPGRWKIWKTETLNFLNVSTYSEDRWSLSERITSNSIFSSWFRSQIVFPDVWLKATNIRK